VSGQLHDLAALPLGKQSLIPMIPSTVFFIVKIFVPECYVINILLFILLGIIMMIQLGVSATLTTDAMVQHLILYQFHFLE
jgi:hypothetical protein